MSYPVFTKAMKKTYTILIPDMLPIHFSLISGILNQYGYHTELLHLSGDEVKETGLRNVNNDACYPALLVVGQFVVALRSGKYDPKKTALLISQTGGGCRASNYIFLIRKALAPLYPDVPVLSFNFSGLEKGNSLHFTPVELLKMAHAACYGDFLMSLYDQSRPYEKTPGETDALLEKGMALIEKSFHNGSYWRRRHYYKKLLAIFNAVSIPKNRKPRVGIVGEIYVKYSPLANNHLADFLVKEGCEVVEPGLLEFCLYCAENALHDHARYGLNKKTYLLWKWADRFLIKETEVQNRLLTKTGIFYPATPFKEIAHNANRIISDGVKMGEGWLIPSEMLAFLEHGVNNIVCCQPFGCLPNHIVGKGMMHPLMRLHPGANIAAIDYDPSTSYVNQENRLKLLLANIKETPTNPNQKTK
jgi:predicted nucleotide-binding protein (sugar kinase/HSP70/actin superfamily)